MGHLNSTVNTQTFQSVRCIVWKIPTNKELRFIFCHFQFSQFTNVSISAEPSPRAPFPLEDCLCDEGYPDVKILFFNKNQWHTFGRQEESFWGPEEVQCKIFKSISAPKSIAFGYFELPYCLNLGNTLWRNLRFENAKIFNKNPFNYFPLLLF